MTPTLTAEGAEIALSRWASEQPIPLKRPRAPGRYDGLTAKQGELLSFIRHRCAAGQSPSFEEMRAELGLATRSNAHRLVASLLKRGYVTQIPGCARAIVPIDDPKPLAMQVSHAISMDHIPTRELVDALKKRGFRFTGSWS